MRHIDAFLIILVFLILCLFPVNCARAQQNIVKNPSFEHGFENWQRYPDSSGKSIVYEGGEHVLRIENTDGSNIGILQDISLEHKNDSILLAEYYIKPIEIQSGALVSMDVKLWYDDGTVQYFVGSLRANDNDIGKWAKKSLTIVPKRNFTRITVYLLNYNSPSMAYYDNVSIKMIGQGNDMTLSNNMVTLTLNSLGYIKSLKYGGSEHLNSQQKLSTVRFFDGTTKASRSIVFLGNDEYEISYKDSNIKVILLIIPKNNYFIFKIRRVENPNNEDVDKIIFFRIYPTHIPQSSSHKEWAENARGDELFLGILPMNNITDFGFSYNSYSCETSRWAGFEGASCALMTSMKSDYFENFENIIRENGLPYVRLEDGVWLRTSNMSRESYMFAKMTSENYENILNYAKEGNFKQVLLIDPVLHGHYSIPRPERFATQEGFYYALQKFVNSGIKIGIHSFFSRIDYNDPLFNPPNESIYKEEIGTLAEDASSLQNTLVIDNDLEKNHIINYFSSVKDAFSLYVNYYLIGNEVLRCDVSENQLVSCSRGMFGTKAQKHSTGEPVYVVPYSHGFFINMNNNKIMNQSSSSFADMAKRFGINFLYADGYTNVPLPGMSIDIARKHSDSGLFPYLNALQTPPFIQMGSGSYYTYLTYYANRVASWDGVCFKNKEFTRNYKLKMVLSDSPFANIFHTLGWWKIHGAEFGTGKRDFDSVTMDDVNYVISKAIATERPIAAHLSSLYERHKKLKDIISLLGIFNALSEEDMKRGIVPRRIKEYLKNPENEADLNNISGYNFVKKVTYKRYAVWNWSFPYNFTLFNPFSKQKLVMEIRPRFDYYGFDDSGNTLIADFSQGSSFDIETMDNKVLCSIDNSGKLEIHNNRNGIGGCKISIPGSFSMANKRGVGISLTGDSGNEIVVIHLHNSGFGYRDFKFVVNFTGTKEIILGNPTTDIYEEIDGEETDWDYSRARRSWHYDYSTNNADLYFYTRPGYYTLKLHSIKALREKPNILANPTIEMNGKKITFPVELYIDDVSANILSYDGCSGNYTLYTSTYGYISNGSMESPVVLEGKNTMSFYSDMSNPDHSSRAELRIFLYDDDDGDKIPTNGSYSDAYFPCNGNNNFCDDNCPDVYNPDQRDFDGDGIGDACDEYLSADENNDGRIDVREIVNFIVKWKTGREIGIKDVINAIKEWKLQLL